MLVEKLFHSRRDTEQAGDDSEEVEPWNNGFQLDADTQTLLELVRQRVVSTDEICRLFVRGLEIKPFLPSDVSKAVDNQMLSGLADYFDTHGASDSFGTSIQSWDAVVARFREEFAWPDIPLDIQHRSQRRAETVPAYAQKNGWVRLQEDRDSWEITAAGVELRKTGGFSFR